MSAAVVEVQVAEHAAPVALAHALPGRQTVSVLAARVGDALVASGARPSVPALAGVRFVAEAVLRVAALPAPGLVAVGAEPAVEAELLARRGAAEVAELVVARPTEGGAAVAVVVERAEDSAGGQVSLWMSSSDKIG